MKRTVGIYLKGASISERFNEIAQKIIRENNELIKLLKISRGYSLIETDKTVYKMIWTSEAARGHRLHKAYYDQTTTLEELHTIIIPATYPLADEEDRIEMIYEVI